MPEATDRAIEVSTTATADQITATVLMASHNRLSLLTESVASALSQDYESFEVLVIDDGSDEETRAWLEEAAEREPGLRVVFQKHSGVGEARARGVREARGEWVCILDSDDLLVPGGLSRLMREIEPDRETALVHTMIRQRLPHGARKVRRYRSFESPQRMIWATLLAPQLPFKHSGTLFRRTIALELGSYDPDFPCKVDIDLYLKNLKPPAGAKGLCGHLDILALFRSHLQRSFFNALEVPNDFCDRTTWAGHRLYR